MQPDSQRLGAGKEEDAAKKELVIKGEGKACQQAECSRKRTGHPCVGAADVPLTIFWLNILHDQ